MTKEQKNEVIVALKEKFSQYSNFYITALSPNTKYFATGGDDYVIKIWNKINSDPKYKNIQIQNKSSIRTGKNKTNSEKNKHTTMLVYKNSKFPQTIIKKTQTTGEELTPINAIIPNNISQIKDGLANNQEQKEIPSNQ